MPVVSITKRKRRRRLTNGAVKYVSRYVVSFRNPATGKRSQRFFVRYGDAIHARDAIEEAIREGSDNLSNNSLSIENAVEHWLADREGQVKPRTLGYYRLIARYIIGPLLVGTPDQRASYSTTGKLYPGADLRPMLGATKISELTTAEIRRWHRFLSDEVGKPSADRAKAHLSTVLNLVAEDYRVRVPMMPRRIGRVETREKRRLLTLEEASGLLKAAKEDVRWGIYYVWPFLTGMRPSEQLGLLWKEIDLERRVVRVCRIQEMDGSLTEATKTAASFREIPLCNLLVGRLREWRIRCPRINGELHRVFPAQGRLIKKPIERVVDAGGPLYYQHFRARVWRPALEENGLPVVTPHSARHLFISGLQAQGVEVGLVAKLAGHSSPEITLGHYTHAVRGGADALDRLAVAFDGSDVGDIA